MDQENSLKKFQICLILFCLIFVILLIILCSTTPPVSRDALTHHLVVPKLYLKYGGIYEIPEIEFSYYPQLLELFYMIPLYFNNDIIPKYIHFVFALLTSLLVYKMLVGKVGEIAASSGALFFLTLPIIVKLSTTVYVDLGLIFFTFLSLYLVLKWFRSQKLSYLIFSAVSCGLAMSCKYNGLITFFCMFFSLIWLESKKHTPTIQIILRLLLFCLISISVFSPWMIKNYVWTGNPVYPLYNSFFKAPEKIFNLVEKKAKANSHFYYRRIIFHETLFETITTPARVFFVGKDDEPEFFDGVLNPFLFLLPLFSMLSDFIKFKKNKIPDYERVLLFFFSWVYIFFVYFQTDMRIRWISPVIGPLTVLSFLGLNDLRNAMDSYKKEKKIVFKAFLYFLLLSMFLLNVKYFKYLYEKIDPIPYLTGNISRDDFIQKNRPEYAAYTYINRQLPESAKIFGLMVGNRRYYCERQMLTDENIFRRIVKTAQFDSDIVSQLHSMGITHVVVGEQIYNSFFIGSFDKESQKILSDFWTHHSKKLFGRYGYSVYKIGI